MTTIKAACPICGEVSLRPEEIELRVDRTAAGDSYYAFTCPSCVAVVRKPADQRVIRLLLTGGVVVLDGHGDAARTGSGGGAPPGPAIGYDDLLDFHALLQSDGWFFRLLQLVRKENVG
ncbi:MAG: hypothetical protein M3276_09915 [Actinomycetota bacterium]|nr:hypothetical protein [Actinomycetota bacterium]